MLIVCLLEQGKHNQKGQDLYYPFQMAALQGNLEKNKKETRRKEEESLPQFLCLVFPSKSGQKVTFSRSSFPFTLPFQ